MSGYTRQSTTQEGNFLKWQSAETKTLTITSDHATRVWQHWIDGRSVECPGEGCVHCENGRARTGRWRLDVLVEGEHATWEMANRVFANVEDIAEMQGTLKGLVLKVLRQGVGRQTRYTMIPQGVGDTTTKKETDIKTRLAYAGELCKTLSLNASVAYKEWLTTYGDKAVGKPKSVTVDAFVAHLEGVAKNADAGVVDSAAQDNDIATMLDGM